MSERSRRPVANERLRQIRRLRQLRQLRELKEIRRPYPERLDRQQRYYRRTVAVRSRILLPLVRPLAALGVTPSAVSYTGVLLVAVMIAVVRDHPVLAFALVMGSALADGVDGVLAHHVGTADDRGKLVDMVCDSASFALFTAGIAHAGLVPGMPAVLLAYFLVMSKVFRSVKNAFYLQTDWHFKAVAGFVPNLVVAVCYLMFGVWAIGGIDAMEGTVYGMTGVLVIDSVVFYVRVLRATGVERPVAGSPSDASDASDE